MVIVCRNVSLLNLEVFPINQFFLSHFQNFSLESSYNLSKYVIRRMIKPHFLNKWIYFMPPRCNHYEIKLEQKIKLLFYCIMKIIDSIMMRSFWFGDVLESRRKIQFWRDFDIFHDTFLRLFCFENKNRMLEQKLIMI